VKLYGGSSRGPCPLSPRMGRSGQSAIDKSYASLVRDGASKSLRRGEASGEGPRTELPLCTQALIYALTKQFAVAEKTLKTLADADLDPLERSICKEAFLVIASARGKKTEELDELARHAISLNSGAFFANRYLGRRRVKEGKYDDALQFLETNLEHFPEDPTTLLDVAQAHALARRRTQALKFVEMARPSWRKGLYWVILRWMGVGRVLFALTLAAPIILLPWPWLVIAAVSGVNIGMASYAFRMRDQLILTSVIVWEAQAISFLILRLVLAQLMKLYS